MKPDTTISPRFCRWPFAPLLATASTAAGYACFRLVHLLDPIGELDYWFYATIYTGIGTITGIAAWYFARLVANDRVSPVLLTLGLALPYAFIMSLALELNPFVAAVATVAFGFILFLTWLAHRARRNETATVPRSDQIPADG